VDSIRRTERLVVDDERRPAIASRVVLREPAHVSSAPLARVIWLETARAARDRRQLLARLRRGPERGRL